LTGPAASFRLKLKKGGLDIFQLGRANIINPRADDILGLAEIFGGADLAECSLKKTFPLTIATG